MRELLQGLLKGLVRAGWPRRRVHLFGFSQGGTAALDLAMHSRRAPLAPRMPAVYVMLPPGYSQRCLPLHAWLREQ